MSSFLTKILTLIMDFPALGDHYPNLRLHITSINLFFPHDPSYSANPSEDFIVFRDKFRERGKNNGISRLTSKNMYVCLLSRVG